MKSVEETLTDDISCSRGLTRFCRGSAKQDTDGNLPRQQLDAWKGISDDCLPVCPFNKHGRDQRDELALAAEAQDAIERDRARHLLGRDLAQSEMTD